MLSLATEASELLRQRRYTESRAAYLRLTNLPLFADQGYLGLGMIALRMGDPHAARWQFLHALRCNPGYAPAHAALDQLDRAQPRAGRSIPQHQLSRPPVTTPEVRPTERGELGDYEYLRSDTSLAGQHLTAALAALPGRRPGSVAAHAGDLTSLAILISVLIGTAIGLSRMLDVDPPVPALCAFGGAVWCLAVLRIRTTVQDLSGGRVTVSRGLLIRRTTTLELSQVRSVERRRTPLDRITGHGELCLTAEAPDREVLRLRGLARRSRLRHLHAVLSDLIFLLRTNSPGPTALAPPAVSWPANHGVGAELPTTKRRGVHRPSAGQPDAERPGVQRPNVQRSGVERSSAERPGVQRAGGLPRRVAGSQTPLQAR